MSAWKNLKEIDMNKQELGIKLLEMDKVTIVATSIDQGMWILFQRNNSFQCYNDNDPNRGYGAVTLYCNFCSEIQHEIENVLGEKWDNLPDKKTRSRVVWSNIGGDVKRIGHIVEDKWFDIDEFWERFDLKGESE